MSLRTKLLCLIFPLFLVSAVLITQFSRKASQIILVEETAKRGLSVTTSLAQSPELLEGFRLRKEQRLLPVLQSVVENSGAVYAAALDAEGRVLAHSNVAEKGKLHAGRAVKEALGSGRPAYRRTEKDGKALLALAYPLWDFPEYQTGEEFLLLSEQRDRPSLGVLELGLSLEGVLRIADQISGYAFWIIALVTALTLVLAVYFTGKIIRPIILLSEGVEKIAEGRFGQEVPVRSQDEVGRLSLNFNRMSRALAETVVSQDFLTAILDNMLDALIVTDFEGRITTLNRSALDLLGYRREELIGKTILRLFPEKDLPLFEEVWLKKILGGSVANLDLALRTQKGENVPVLLSGSVMKAKDGAIQGIIGVARDMRERKKLEAQMAQSQKLSAVGQLAAGVAHELHNPLFAIHGFAEILLSGLKKEDPMAEILKSIVEQSLRCKRIIQDLLHFSRKRERQRSEFDLIPAMSSALTWIEAQARVKSVKVVRRLGPESVKIRGDEVQIQQVLINLASNAMDSMPNGGTLTVSVRKISAADGDSAQIQVSDMGSGIPESVQDRIFEPFFTTKEPGQGTGLGLTLIHEIVQNHQGEITFISKEGEGTVFSVSFPLINGI